MSNDLGSIARRHVAEDQESRLHRIEKGRQAVQAAAFIIEPVRESQEVVLRRLINDYRAGKTDHDRIVGGIAEIAALDKLMAELKNAETQGNAAAQKEFQYGKDTQKGR